MKNFFKILTASCLGTAIVLIALPFLIVWACMPSEKATPLTEESVLYMDLAYEIPERSTDNYDFMSIIRSQKLSDNTGMNDIIANIRDAAKNDKIKGIFIESSAVGTGWANLEELRTELLKFKESGKFIIAYADGYSQGAYDLATVADKIYLVPDGSLDIRGMAVQLMFYKRLMDRLGVEMQIVRGPDNKFKSAVEPYFLEKMSESNRLQYTELLNSMWSVVAEHICTSRNVDLDRLNAAVNDATFLFDAQSAVDFNLIDGLRYRDEVIAEIKGLMGLAEDNDIAIISNKSYAEQRVDDNDATDKIAIIYANGSIIDGEGDDSTIGSITLSKAIREARTDENVKAIVMRVNSPGGSALASEVIRREVELAGKEKPFIVSMGDYAASGGYWISTQSNYIFADNNTLTGSIGVFGTFPNFKNLAEEKIGLTFDGVKTHDNADFGIATQPLTERQMGLLEKYVGKTYYDFVNLVSRTRNIPVERVDEIAQGRVWSGKEAINIGLVDEIGTLDDAIKYAAEKVALSDYKVVSYPEQENFFTSFMNQGVDYYTEMKIKSEFGEFYPYFKTLRYLREANGVQALCTVKVE